MTDIEYQDQIEDSSALFDFGEVRQYENQFIETTTKHKPYFSEYSDDPRNNPNYELPLSDGRSS